MLSSLGSVPLTGTVHASGWPFPGAINGVDFGPDGTLYGIGFGFYTIDVVTGVASRVTPLGQDVSGDLFDDLDLSPDGLARSASWTDSPSHLYTIDPATGIGSFVGSMGADISGLASVPEPSSGVLFVLGALLTAPRHFNRGCRYGPASL